MHVACLFVAGALRAIVPAADFTLAWTHSIEKTRWEERYRVQGAKLRLVQARVRGSGAGVDPGPGAVLGDGWWTWTPDLAPLGEIRLTLSSYTAGYDLCWRGRCHSLREVVSAPDASRFADGTVVQLRACRSPVHE